MGQELTLPEPRSVSSHWMLVDSLQGGADGENDQDFDDEFSDDDGLVEFDQADAEENKELEVRLFLSSRATAPFIHLSCTDK
jgi:hypothetical protein